MEKGYGAYFGGEIETMEHLPLLFPSDTLRRKVRIYIHSYIGMSFGAVHWYADLTEEDNCYVDHEAKKYRAPWGVWEHDHLRGRQHKKSFKSKAEAQEWACEVLKEHYSPDDYYVFVDFDSRGNIYRELGFVVDTMYLSDEEEMAEGVRRGLAARYKMGDI